MPMAVFAMAFGDGQVTPTSFVIDRQGYIMRRGMGDWVLPHFMVCWKERWVHEL
jgi:hypothetical protein